MRANKTILSKSKFELALICPGEVTESYKLKEKIFAKEPKRAMALQVFTNQLKGNLLEHQ